MIKPTKEEQLRNIVKEHQCAKIDGVLVDVMTASAIVQILDNINETNKAKYLALDIIKMSNVAWSLINKRED